MERGKDGDLKGKSTLKKVFLEMYFFERASEMMTNIKNRRTKALSVPEIMSMLYLLIMTSLGPK